MLHERPNVNIVTDWIQSELIKTEEWKKNENSMANIMIELIMDHAVCAVAMIVIKTKTLFLEEISKNNINHDNDNRAHFIVHLFSL